MERADAPFMQSQMNYNAYDPSFPFLKQASNPLTNIFTHKALPHREENNISRYYCDINTLTYDCRCSAHAPMSMRFRRFSAHIASCLMPGMHAHANIFQRQTFN